MRIHEVPQHLDVKQRALFCAIKYCATRKYCRIHIKHMTHAASVEHVHHLAALRQTCTCSSLDCSISSTASQPPADDTHTNTRGNLLTRTWRLSQCQTRHCGNIQAHHALDKVNHLFKPRAYSNMSISTSDAARDASQQSLVVSAQTVV